MLSQVPDDQVWREAAEGFTHDHEHRVRHLATRPARQRAAMERGYAEMIASLPYAAEPTTVQPLPGGAPAWDDLAARAMFQCPRD